MVSLGNYAYKANILTLCTKQQLGANPEIANMHLKRYIIFSEPESSEKIHNSILKELTGNMSINARKLYDNECQIIIQATIILECNEKISLKNDSTDAEVRRIVDYYFGSKFTSDISEVDEENRIYLSKPINEDFVEKYKLAFIDILIDKAYEFINTEKQIFSITESVKKATEKYISTSCVFLNFLNDMTEKTNNDNEFISLSELHCKFKMSDYYINSSRDDKREKLIISKMKDFFQKNKTTMIKYKAEYDKTTEDGRIRAKSVLLGYKFKNIEENI
jgi:phage/plasmid-associated DNA primase